MVNQALKLDPNKSSQYLAFHKNNHNTLGQTTIYYFCHIFNILPSKTSPSGLLLHQAKPWMKEKVNSMVGRLAGPPTSKNLRVGRLKMALQEAGVLGCQGW